MKRVRYFRRPVALLIPRKMRPDELPVVRRLWWRWRRHEGVELPAESDIIIIRGGRS